MSKSDEKIVMRWHLLSNNDENINLSVNFVFNKTNKLL